MSGRAGRCFALAIALATASCSPDRGDPAVRLGDVYYFARLPPPLHDHGALAHLTAVSGDDRRVRYTFVTEAEAVSPGVRFEVERARSQPRSFVPLVDNADLARVRARFEGRFVWSYGAFYVICEDSTPTLVAHGPLRVRKIVQITSTPTSVGFGPAGYLNGGNPLVETDSPLIVFFDPPAAGIERGNVAGPRRCVDQWAFANAAQLDVAYAPDPPERAHPEWSPAIRAAVAAGRVTPGMTHAMVAWSRGFPGQPGTRAALLRARVWHYPQPPPGEATVLFTGDRVVRFIPAP